MALRTGFTLRAGRENKAPTGTGQISRARDGFADCAATPPPPPANTDWSWSFQSTESGDDTPVRTSLSRFAIAVIVDFFPLGISTTSSHA